MWDCFQIGAREHYAIPRALQQRGLLNCLVTDVWASPGSVSARLPGRTGNAIKLRFHEQLGNASVVGFNYEALALEATSWRRCSGWERVITRNDWFQHRAAMWMAKLNDSAVSMTGGVVFSYSYAAREIFNTAKALGFSTVLGQIDPGPAEFRLVAELSRQAGIPVQDEPPASYWDVWQQECELADRILVNSAWSQEVLTSEGVPAEKIAVVPLAFERPKLEMAPKVPADRFSADRPLRLLFLGQVIVRKGIVELIDAIHELQEAHVEWHIVGPGNSILLDRLRASPKTEVWGPVSRAQAEQHYRNADVFLLPTHSDGYAITQLEAAAYGLPIISSRFCGDVVIDGCNGLVMQAVSGHEITDKVREFLDKPELLSNLSMTQLGMPPRGTRELANDLADLQAELANVAKS